MARPKKAVVDYFPHYVVHGKTMFTLENKFKKDGYCFWFKLLELLGESEQHFINCNDDEVFEYMLARTLVDEDLGLQILNLLSKLNAIDSELWENKIIWSQNFINNLDGVYSRREINVYTKEDVLGLCIQKLHLEDDSDNINPQSKVEESKDKLEYSKEDKKSSIFSSDIAEIIDYLNKVLGTNYRATTKATQDVIKARLKEKYVIDDFKYVIDIKYDDWHGDSKTEPWLRPSTLFGNKFESYLNQKPKNAMSELPKNLQNAFRLAEEEQNKEKELNIFEQIANEQDFNDDSSGSPEF